MLSPWQPFGEGGGNATHGTAAAASSPPVGLTTTTDARKSIQDKLQESIRQRLAVRGVVMPAATSSAAPGDPEPMTQHADPVGQGPSTPVSAHTPDDSAANKSGGGQRVASSSPGGCVRDRIAAWRASKGTPGSGGVVRSSRSATPQATSSHGGDNDHDGQGNWSGPKQQQSTPVLRAMPSAREHQRCLWDFHLPHIASTRNVHAEDVAIALCDEWCKGYYHFTHEHLPRVAAVHRLLLERNTSKLVLSHSPNGFQRQFLTDVLGIPKDQIIHGKAVLGTTAVYPMPMRCGNTFTTMLYMLRRIVYDRLDLGEGPTIPRGQGQSPPDGEDGSAAALPTTKLRLLFAERKHLSRMPTNYADLKRRLMAEFDDHVEYDTTTGDSDARTQIERFHRADIVVGPHGANIANMMWMRHGTHVVEIASRRKGNMCYYTTASRINVTHHLVLHNKGKDAAFELDYDYLRRHVEHAIRLIRAAAV